MIEKYLIVLALKKILKRYDYDLDRCLSDIESMRLKCIRNTIQKYKEIIEGLLSGKD